MFDQLYQDATDGLRALRSAPLGNATIVCLIALVVGGNTTIYGLVHALLTKPARGVLATDLISVQRVEPGGSIGPLHHYSDFESFRDSRALDRIAAVRLEPLTLRASANTDTVRGAAVTPHYFELFGITLLRGQTFSDADRVPGAGVLPVIISEQLWRTRFDSTPDIVDQPVYVNSHAATVAGVVPAAFRGATLGELTDVWLPLRSSNGPTGAAQDLPSARPSVQVFARLADGGSQDETEAELSLLMAASHSDLPGDSRPGARLLPYSMTTAGDSMIAQMAPRFLVLFSVVTALTLVIVCANIANLVWVRGLNRERELAMRAAIGATRWQLLRPVVAETLMLGMFAWTAATLLAGIATRLLVQLLDAQSAGAFAAVDATVDASVLAYAALLAFGSVAVCSAVPAFRVGRADLNTIVGCAYAAPRRSRGATTLIVTQLTLSVVLLLLAGLAYRSVSESLRADLGFDPARVHLVRIDTAGVTNAGSRAVLLERIRQAVSELYEVEAASHATTTPAVRGRRVAVSGSPDGSQVTAERIEIGPEFFRVLGIGSWRGREFSAADLADQRPVTIVNRNLADSLWAARPIVVGQQLVVQDEVERQLEVVGVVPDGLFTGPRGQVAPAFVFLPSPTSSGARSVSTLYIRVASGAELTAATIRQAIGQVDPRVAIASISTMMDAIDTLTAPQRMVVRMATGFAVACLLISAIGLYGLVSFTVARRTREFGVRQALGSSRTMLLFRVLREALTLALLGVACGFTVGGGIAVASRALLFGVSPLDITTYVSIAMIVGLVTVAATCVPAIRASRVDPVVALRAD